MSEQSKQEMFKLVSSYKPTGGSAGGHRKNWWKGLTGGIRSRLCWGDGLR